MGPARPRGAASGRAPRRPITSPVRSDDDGLVVQHDLVLLDRLPEPVHRLQPREVRPGAARAGRGLPVRATLASYIARSACCSRSAGRDAVLGEDRDADAGGDVERRGKPAGTVDAARPAAARRPGSPGSTRPRRGPPRTRRHRSGPAGPVAQAVQQPVGHAAQQLVTVVVAQGVVDDLEGVEVDDQQRKRTVAGRVRAAR